MANNTKSININLNTLEELKSLVEHRKSDSVNTIIEKFIDKYKNREFFEKFLRGDFGTKSLKDACKDAGKSYILVLSEQSK